MSILTIIGIFLSLLIGGPILCFIMDHWLPILFIILIVAASPIGFIFL